MSFKQILTALALAVAGLAAAFPSFLQENTPSLVEIYDLRSFTHQTHTRIVIDIGKLREYSPAELRGPDRVLVDILEARLNPILHGKTIPVETGYLTQIRIAQKTPSTVRATLELDFAKIDHYRVWHLYDPFRLIIDIYPKEPVAAAKERAPQPARPTTSGYSLARQLGLGVKTIVIDPGHGGTDPGCMSKKGQKEKDIALDIALELKKLIVADKGPEAILTRETDIFIPLENRTVVANQKNADIFVSIHVNAHPNKNRSGVQTFFLNLSPDPAVVEIAARENATSTKNISHMQEIIKKILRNSKIIESRELAEKIQKNLVKCFSQKYSHVQDLGVRGGPFWVLIGGEMPSVLVEISHLSNAMEEKRLGTPQYRKLAARGIYEGIVEYLKSLGKG